MGSNEHHPTSKDRRAWGRIGGLKLAASRDPRTYTEAGRSSFLARFYRDLPPGLSQAERDRRATAAKKAYFVELAIKSARTRRLRAGRRDPGGPADPR